MCTIRRSRTPKWRHVRPPASPAARARARARSMVSPMWVTHMGTREAKSSRYEPETLHSKPDGGLSAENEERRERETRGRIRGSKASRQAGWKGWTGDSGGFSLISQVHSRPVPRTNIARASTSFPSSLHRLRYPLDRTNERPAAPIYYPRPFGTTSCHLKEPGVYPHPAGEIPEQVFQ